MLLQKAEALSRERALMKELARAEEDHLRAMAEENALCTACNMLHERQGMKDCPVCRTSIMKRIQARRFVPPKAH
nr:putative E3 ubiquitin-protein ligase RF4 [Ipomoea trifida]